MRLSGVRDGRRKHYLYNTYMNMYQRCYNKEHKDYPDYGGRGINVCASWYEDFWKFVEDMGDRPANHSIDRIDNNKGYYPENCRWADSKTQTSNKRTYKRKPLSPRWHSGRNQWRVRRNRKDESFTKWFKSKEAAQNFITSLNY